MYTAWEPALSAIIDDSPSVRENMFNNSKNLKSHVFWVFQKRKKLTHNFSWLFNVYCSSSLLSESDTAQRCHSMFSNGSEWITLEDLETELQWSLSEVCELISMDWRLTTFVKDFYDFLICQFKKLKKLYFLNLKKNKIRVLELWTGIVYVNDEQNWQRTEWTTRCTVKSATPRTYLEEVRRSYRARYNSDFRTASIVCWTRSRPLMPSWTRVIDKRQISGVESTVCLLVLITPHVSARCCATTFWRFADVSTTS